MVGFWLQSRLCVPPSGEMTDEGFRRLVLQLRGRTGLTLRELGVRVGVNVNSIQGWETGANYPGLASLKALVAAVGKPGRSSWGDAPDVVNFVGRANERELLKQ
jgi:transcriptional regulator with XRE-family HTH domain